MYTRYSWTLVGLADSAHSKYLFINFLTYYCFPRAPTRTLLSKHQSQLPAHRCRVSSFCASLAASMYRSGPVETDRIIIIIIIFIFRKHETLTITTKSIQCIQKAQNSLTGRLYKVHVIQWKQCRKTDSVQTTEVVQVLYGATPRLNMLQCN